jgi:hypothetical protein
VHREFPVPESWWWLGEPDLGHLQAVGALAARQQPRGHPARLVLVRPDHHVAVDLACASAPLHHLARPDHTLSHLVTAIRRGGLLAVIELAGFLVSCPTTLPAARRRRALTSCSPPTEGLTCHDGQRLGPRLTRAGLVVEMDRPIVVGISPPSAPVVGSYAAFALSRIHAAVADRLEAPDRKALEALLQGGASDLPRRTDLQVSTERRLWIARRPHPPAS